MHPTELSDRASLDPDVFRRESRMSKEELWLSSRALTYFFAGIDNEGGHDCVDAAEDSSLQISSTTSSKDKRGKQVVSLRVCSPLAERSYTHAVGQASAVLEDRRQRNRQAQATFRLRRNEHLKQLEATIQQHQQTIRDLQESVRVASDDCLMLRYKNSILERVLLEKGIDVREEVYAKPLLPTKRRVSGASSRNSSSVQCGRNKRARDTLYPGSAPAVQAPVQTKTTSSSFHVGRLVPEVFASAPATSSVAPSVSEQSQSSTSRSPRLSQWQPRTTVSAETGMRTVRATKQAQDFQQAARARKHDLEHPHHNRSALQMPRPTSTTTSQSASRPRDPSRGHSVVPYSTMATATSEEAGHGHEVSFEKTTKKPHHALGKLPPSLFCPFLLGSCDHVHVREHEHEHEHDPDCELLLTTEPSHHDVHAHHFDFDLGIDIDMDMLENTLPELVPSQSTPTTVTYEELQDLSPFNAYGGGLDWTRSSNLVFEKPVK
ncbi:hypothetical protein PV08_01715 [Exophiala spinifera]|uniref:BZIP domain-containing protein n=1 Tax=Exophiala spinifera TaxID=91928 RepID=A0A0D2BRU9_9EURO|nr:uncharacterized protein PV08_01715 [Exophiala spinifera]KIW21135.1 hypothetical protein PV08_01715 [Exophiala spinifera]